MPAVNQVLPKAGLNGFDWTFVQSSTFIFRLNSCAKFPPSAIPELLADSVFDDTTSMKQTTKNLTKQDDQTF
jgi:hypothetical protein